jgi:hypothetical protein
LSALTALTAGLLATAVVAALAEIVSLSIFAAKVLPGDSLANAAKRGLLFVYLFTHVGMKLSTAALVLPHGAAKTVGLPSGLQLTASLAFAFMLGTGVVVAAFYLAGRWAGRIAGGSVWRRAVWGASPALVFAAGACAVSYVFTMRVALPQTSTFVLHIARRGAFFWPVVLGGVSGALGGFRSTPRAQLDAWLKMRVLDRSIARWRGAFAGAKRMLVMGMVLSLVSLVAYAAIHPSAARAYFAAGHGAGGTAMLILITALALPNIATWILVPAMGGCLDVGGGMQPVPPGPYCFLGYTHSLSHRFHAIDHEWAFVRFHHLGGLPAIYLLFLLVPLVATCAGGARAVRVARAENAKEVALVSVMTALVFTLAMVAVLAVSLTTITTLGPDPMSNQYFRYGPYPAYGVQLALTWGFVGAFIGGTIARARDRARAGAA